MLVLIGSQGSMGKRYQAILNYLGVKYRGFDIGDGSPWDAAACSEGVILATPTQTHGALIQRVGGKVPILCEKPLSTDLDEMDQILDISNPLQMMAQYRYCDWKSCDGDTSYNYYQSGNDGLGWDCMVLIGLARGAVQLKNTSPWWRCCLNGRNLTLNEVQKSYVWAVEDWLKKPEGDRMWIRYAHEKAAIWVPETPAWTICSQSLGADVPRSQDASPEALVDHEGH